MIWILAVIAVGLIAVLAEMVLVYQRRAYELRMKQEPLRRRVRRHRKEMEEAAERIWAAAEQGLRDFEHELADHKRQLEPKKQLVLELEHEVLVEYQEPEPAAPGDQEEEEGRIATPAVFDRGQELRSLVRTVRNKQEELENHLTSLQRDIDITQRLLERMQSKVHRKPTGDNVKKSGTEKAEEETAP